MPNQLKMIDDVMAILRVHPTGELLKLDDLKERLTQAGHTQVVAPHIESALAAIAADGLIGYDSRIGGWKITQISPDI